MPGVIATAKVSRIADAIAIPVGTIAGGLKMRTVSCFHALV